MNIQEKVIQKIKEEHIEPISRWKFVASNYSLWGATVGLVIIATLGLSTLLHVINEGEWDIYENFNMSFAHYVATVFPYVWLMLFLVVGLFAFLVLRLTKRGYRYTTGVVVSIGLITSTIFGFTFFFLGAGSFIDEALTNHILLYRTLPHHNVSIWNNPSKGLVAGTITEIESPTQFTLVDFNKIPWTIVESSTTWQRSPLRVVGAKIKIIGSSNNNGTFSAIEIRPWQTISPRERIIFPVRSN